MKPTQQKHSAAIAALEIAAENCETNAPIHEGEGNQAQADLSRANATSYREAIVILKRDGAKVYPLVSGGVQLEAA